jgi:hypothetical protein
MQQWISDFYPKPSVQDNLLECIQDAGTLLYVPDNWHHATINLEDTIGIAVEAGPSTVLVEPVD